jgi:Lrp/AsnC family transcriptional regulator, leucine-responsive regulatory protein
MIDKYGKNIIQLLQTNARMSNAELSRRIGLSPPATLARIKRLEEDGLIKQYATIVDRQKAGYDMLCFVSVSLQLHEIHQVTGFYETIRDMPEVLECHHVTGNYDYLLKVVAKNTGDLEDFLINRLTPIPGVARIHTSLVLRETKNSTNIPL